MDISKTDSNTPISNNALSQTSKQEIPQDNKFQRELDRDALNVGEVAGRSQVVKKDIYTYKELSDEEKNKLELQLIEKAKEFPEICEELKFIPITKYNIHFLNRFLHTEKINQDPQILENFSELMESIVNKNSAKMADYLFTNQYVQNSPTLKPFVPFLIGRSVEKEENEVVKEFIKNKKLHDSVVKVDTALNLINMVEDSPEIAKIVKEIFNCTDFWKSEIIKDKDYQDCLWLIFDHVTDNGTDDNFSFKLAEKIFSDKKFFANKNIINTVNAIQHTYQNIPDKYLDLKNEFLYNLLDTPEIFEDTSLMIAVLSSSDAAISKETAKTLSDKRVLEFISKKSNGNKYKVQADMGENVFNMIISPRGGNTVIIRFRVGDEIKTLSHTTYSKNIKQHKKELPNGEYIVSKSSADGSFRKTLYDSDGVQKYSEVVKKDEETGQYSITGYERGLNKAMEPKILASLEFKNEEKTNRAVERNFETPDGTKLEYYFKSSPKKTKMSYKITDKDSKELLSINRSFKEIDLYHTVSTVNDDRYETRIDPKGIITVVKTDKNGKQETVKLSTLTLDFRLIGIYQKLPGDAFFDLAKHKVKTIMGGKADKNNACYVAELTPEEKINASDVLLEKNRLFGNSICVDKELRTDGFGFMHELGHAIDSNNQILEKYNKELMPILRKEYSEYQKVSSLQENNSIAYFTEFDDDEQNIEKVVKEIYAEANALASGLMPEDNDTINDRGMILQKYFPETMAFVTSKLYGTNQSN